MYQTLWFTAFAHTVLQPYPAYEYNDTLNKGPLHEQI